MPTAHSVAAVRCYLREVVVVVVGIALVHRQEMARTNCFSLQIMYSHLLFLCGLRFAVCALRQEGGREEKLVCGWTGAERWVDAALDVVFKKKNK